MARVSDDKFLKEATVRQMKVLHHNEIQVNAFEEMKVKKKSKKFISTSMKKSQASQLP